VYRILEHTSEVELEIEDATVEDVFAEALVAVGDLLAVASQGEAVTREIRAEAGDLPALLAAWIEELVYLAETDGFIPQRIERLNLDGTRLDAVVGGERSVPQSLIKAVTYHDLELEQVGGACRARVVLDV
jgi:SHS2 domain-containing protein